MPEINIPLSVPSSKRSEYAANYRLATAGSGRLLLFAGDQKVEHLNDDFFGRGIAAEDASPEHLFRIAAAAKGAVLAVHPGLAARYGASYRQIPYVIKLNGKTNIGPSEEKDSSACWWSAAEVAAFKKQSGLKIVGIGYTVYLGSRYEAQLLQEAAKAIKAAHENGLLAIIWMYPRGRGINEENIHTIAGGAGVAAALGADFVKLKYPYGLKDGRLTAKKYQEAVLAAGRTKIICVGGAARNAKELIKTTKEQLEIAGTAGLAIGRNLHQRPLKEATKLANELQTLIHKKKEKKKSAKLSFFGLF
jgi:fructose-bisphosphate aldolase/6-deoxy-5-ketofructose 1-phosphate synthase